MKDLLSNFNFALSTIEETVQRLLALNEKTLAFGLIITPEIAYALVASKSIALKNHHRFEVDDRLLDKIVLCFADSPYLMQHDFADTIAELLDIFMSFKAECFEGIQDLALLEYMKKAYDGPCGGSLDLLANLSLAKLARVYKGHYLPEFND